MTLPRTLLAAAIAAALPAAAAAQAHHEYEVRVTNLTPGQQFTPVLAVTHRPSLHLFALGTTASAELRALAEAGDTAPFTQQFAGSHDVTQVLTAPGMTPPGLTDPGATTLFTISARPARDRLSLAAMLIPTNDRFVAVDGIDLPESFAEKVHYARAYDSGTEINDELCASIPGPYFVECNGSGGGAQVGDGEGFVHVANGMHGHGDFSPTLRDWRNPVAQVRIRRVR